MKKRNSIPLDSYCPRHMDSSRRKSIVKWIKEAEALATIDGKRYIDFPKFDTATLKVLDDERNQIKADFDFHSAASHVAKAFDLLHTRYEFMDRIRDRNHSIKKMDMTELKRQLKVASQNFGELADRLILAYELFFDAEPSKAEISDARGTIDAEQYYL